MLRLDDGRRSLGLKQEAAPVRFSAGTRANENGMYVVRGPRAGTYRLATILDAQFGAWFDPAYLRGIDPSSMTVTFTGDESKTLLLRVPGDR